MCDYFWTVGVKKVEIAGREVYRTVEFCDGLSANRERAFVKVLNPENVITENRRFIKNGKWSHDKVSWIFSPPLYVMQYYHSTHPSPGSLKVYKFDAEKGESIYWISEADDYIKDIPEELKQYREEILKWIWKYMEELFLRTYSIYKKLQIDTRELEEIMKGKYIEK